MQTENVFIAHPTNKDQIDALKAVVKALKVKFEIRKEPIIENSDASDKIKIIENIKEGFKEMKLIQSGKMKGTPLKEFLNELKYHPYGLF